MLEFSRLNVFTETTLTSNIEVSRQKTKNKNAKQQKNKDTHEGRRLVVSSLTTSLESSKFRRMSSSCICSKPKICSATGNCICDMRYLIEFSSTRSGVPVPRGVGVHHIRGWAILCVVRVDCCPVSFVLHVVAGDWLDWRPVREILLQGSCL